MKSFKDFAIVDVHCHPSFEKMYRCYMAYIDQNIKCGTIQHQTKIDVDQCREEFRVLLLEGSLSLSRVSASELVNSSIQDHTEEAMHLLQASKSSSPVGTSPTLKAVLEREKNSKFSPSIDKPLTSESLLSSQPTRVLLKRGRTSRSDIASKTARHGNPSMIIRNSSRFTLEEVSGGSYQPPEHDAKDGAKTPPRNVQGHNEDIPLVEDLAIVFRHVDESATFRLSEIDQGLYDEASKWFKSKIKTSTELTIAEMRKTRFQENWIHDLLYDR
ncbi:hypothetical protein BGZ50_005800 [Haplosporangium sp. Z 11]|nr:hypothetical protein BGZ50_005800 [Haplosporangium sp. Z 11]